VVRLRPADAAGLVVPCGIEAEVKRPAPARLGNRDEVAAIQRRGVCADRIDLLLRIRVVDTYPAGVSRCVSMDRSNAPSIRAAHGAQRARLARALTPAE